jgi:hypothetical protein
MTLLSLFIVTAGPPTWDIDRVVRFLEAQRVQLKSISFDYEAVRRGGGADDGALLEAYSGRERFRAEGQRIWIMTHRTHPEPNRFVLVRENGKLFESDGDLSAPRLRWRDSPTSWSLEGPGFFHGFVTPLTISPSLSRAYANRLIVKGMERIDEIECLMISHVTHVDHGGVPQSENRYWLAMDRDGVLMKREILINGTKANETRTLEIRRFESPGGRLWLPTRLRTLFFQESAEAMNNDILAYTKQLGSNEVASLLPDTVRINDPVSDELLGRDVSKSLPGMESILEREREEAEKLRAAKRAAWTPAQRAHRERMERLEESEKEPFQSGAEPRTSIGPEGWRTPSLIGTITAIVLATWAVIRQQRTRGSIAGPAPSAND